MRTMLFALMLLAAPAIMEADTAEAAPVFPSEAPRDEPGPCWQIDLTKTPPEVYEVPC